MSIENMFGDLDKIDILAETKTGEVVMVLVCNGFIDGSPETQKALLDKMEGYLNHTQSEEFQKEYPRQRTAISNALSSAGSFKSTTSVPAKGRLSWCAVNRRWIV